MKAGDRVQVLVVREPDTYRVATVKRVYSWCVTAILESTGVEITTVQEHIIPVRELTSLTQEVTDD